MRSAAIAVKLSWIRLSGARRRASSARKLEIGRAQNEARLSRISPPIPKFGTGVAFARSSGMAKPQVKGGLVRVAFICSAAHSGSTLLDLLLGSHPEAVSLGEITHLPKNLALNTACTCGAPARDCRVWARILDAVEQIPAFRSLRQDPYVLNLGLIKASDVIDRRQQTAARMAYRKVAYSLCYANLRWGVPIGTIYEQALGAPARNKLLLFDAVAKVLAKRLVVDSSKHYLEAVSLYRSAPSDVRVILLVRDGRGVYYSALKRGRSYSAAVNAWEQTYRRALPILERHVHRTHLLKVRYEDLAEAPERELRRLCSFLGVTYDAEMLEFAAKEHHILNGNNMRFNPDGQIRPDLSWRQHLSPVDLSYFYARAGRLNRLLGYQ